MQAPTRTARSAPSSASSRTTIAALGPPIPVDWIAQRAARRRLAVIPPQAVAVVAHPRRVEESLSEQQGVAGIGGKQRVRRGRPRGLEVLRHRAEHMHPRYVLSCHGFGRTRTASAARASRGPAGGDRAHAVEPRRRRRSLRRGPARRGPGARAASCSTRSRGAARTPPSSAAITGQGDRRGRRDAPARDLSLRSRVSDGPGPADRDHRDLEPLGQRAGAPARARSHGRDVAGIDTEPPAADLERTEFIEADIRSPAALAPAAEHRGRHRRPLRLPLVPGAAASRIARFTTST